MFKLVQITAFPCEIRALQNGDKFPRSISILRLTPYFDKESLLWLGGRLPNSALKESEMHQIILPVNHNVTWLLIEKPHRDMLHGRPALVISSLLCKFWIGRARNTMRCIIRNCDRCAPLGARTLEQLMGPLPDVRLSPTRLFTYAGVDFLGPFILKATKLRGGPRFYKDLYKISPLQVF